MDTTKYGIILLQNVHFVTTLPINLTTTKIDQNSLRIEWCKKYITTDFTLINYVRNFNKEIETVVVVELKLNQYQI